MRNWLEHFKSYVFYADIGKEEFQKLYPQIEDQMREDNKKSLGIFSLIGVILFAGMMLASLLNTVLSEYRPLYVTMLGISLITFAANRNRTYRTMKAVRCAVYLFIFAILVFSVILGTVFSPDELATTFFVMLIAAPLVFHDRPSYFACVIVASYIVFVALAIMFKAPDCLPTDLTNATVFALFSLAACVFMMNVKLQRYFLVQRTRIASETDVLTGLKNRTCFESCISGYLPELLESTYFVYLDANGLHELNNEKGHAAGDEMIRCIADELKKAFGENTFRIGGDEFVAFGTKLTHEELEKKTGDMVGAISACGYNVSVGCDIGTTAATLDELIKTAEAKMYAAKAEYYKNSGRDRRRSR